uniref:Ras association domain family member 2a n=1 Tax=Cyprinus carpio TaxID=7962 RepID=A0A8C1UTR6_CYPCA
MDDRNDGVRVGENKFISKRSILSHLKTYNLYYEGKNLQLRHRERLTPSVLSQLFTILIIEGLLNISWGLRRPIRLQMQDDHERIRPPPSSTSWHSGCNLDNQSQEGQKQTPQTPPQLEVTPPEDHSSNGTTQENEEEEEACDLSAQLLRTKSDAGVLRRGRRRSPSDQRRIRRHRFSINGHFYNHKTAVFTPAYGSVTNVRINSCMTTPQVLRVLLNKFKIENSPDEFALYLVHASGGQLLSAFIYQLIKNFTVAQYIKFEMPVLQSFITKLKEEEDREVQKLRSRYKYLRCIIEKQLQCLPEGSTCM